MSPRMMPKSMSGRSCRAEALSPAGFKGRVRDDVVVFVFEPPGTCLLDHEILVPPEGDLGFAAAAEKRDEVRLVPDDARFKNGDHLVDRVMAGKLHAVGEECRIVGLDGRAARMDAGRIPEHAILGEHVDKISYLVDTVADRAVRRDELAYFFLGLEAGEPGLDVEFGH